MCGKGVFTKIVCAELTFTNYKRETFKSMNKLEKLIVPISTLK